MENSSRFGDPGPGPITTPGVALLAKAFFTPTAVSAGNRWRHSAAVPVECGAAIEVPLRLAYALGAVYQAEKMALPGAKKSRPTPKLENPARLSVIVVAPTVVPVCPAAPGQPSPAPPMRAGENKHASAFELPAANVHYSLAAGANAPPLRLMLATSRPGVSGADRVT